MRFLLFELLHADTQTVLYQPQEAIPPQRYGPCGRVPIFRTLHSLRHRRGCAEGFRFANHNPGERKHIVPGCCATRRRHPEKKPSRGRKAGRLPDLRWVVVLVKWYSRSTNLPEHARAAIRDIDGGFHEHTI